MIIVGIGASAGGLQAIVGALEVFKTTPKEACFVVIQHLAPGKKSYMLDILSNKLSLPVKVIDEVLPLEAGTVYLAPPGKLITLFTNTLVPSEITNNLGPQKNIDYFFKSLALNFTTQSIGVILSGTGTDGLQGCQHLYEAGAEIFVQDPLEAEFRGMPDAIIQSGFYTKKIQVAELEVSLAAVLTTKEDSPSQREAFQEIQKNLGTIGELLHNDFGIDLSFYKPGTLLRRIARRMEMLNHKKVTNYLDFLRADAPERKALFEEIMIAVTAFFRDEDFFRSLEEQIDFSHVTGSNEVRAWVAGCSRGQEAYSLAIILLEYREKHGLAFGLKIFTTDINTANIEYASRGSYHVNEVETVPPHLLEKYFTAVDNRYVVAPELRDALIFSQHDLITSPPFSNLDIVSCRNLLIYFNQKSQKRALTNLLFSLRVGGILALGPSETLGELANSTSVIDGKWRLFRKTKKLSDLSQPKWVRPFGPKPQDRSERVGKLLERHQDKSSSLKILETLYPHCLIISEHFDVLAIFGRAHLLLNKTPSGIASLSLDQLVNPQLGVSLPALLLEAKHKKIKLTFQCVAVQTEDASVLSEIAVSFIEGEQGEGLFLCDVGTLEAPQAEVTKSALEKSDVVSSLELELHNCRRQLDDTLAAMEESQEELQTTNEELISSNEELQSTNEELNSVNEELYTLNSELQEKMNLLALTNADLENLINALNIGVIYLDKDHIIRRITNHPASLLDVRSQDVGRSLFDLKAGEILRALHAKIRSGSKLDESIEYVSESKYFYLIRVTSFLDARSHEQGYIITIVDITDSKKNEIFLEETHKVTKMGGWLLDLVTMKPTWSRQVYAIHEVDYGTPIDLAQAINYYAPHERQRIADVVEKCQEGHSFEETFEFITAKKRHIWVRVTGRPTFAPSGHVSMIKGTFQDITDMRLSDQRFSLALEATQTGVWTWDYQTGGLVWDKQMYQFYGVKIGSDMSYNNWRQLIHPDDIIAVEGQLLGAIQSERLYSGHFRVQRPDGEIRWLSCTAKGLHNKDNRLYQVIGVNRDDTEEINLRVRIEEEKKLNQQAQRMAAIGELAAGIGHEVNNPLAIMVSHLEILKERMNEDVAAQRSIEKVLDAGLRIRDIVDGLRSVARDYTSEPPQICEVDKLLESIYRLLYEIYKKEGIDLVLNSVPMKTFIKVRHGAIQQVLMNLLSNAHDAISGAERKRIQLSASYDSTHVYIDVTDTGHGIPRSQLERVFDNFFTTKEIGKGTGLGLSISKKIVDEEGGTLAVESTEGSGTTFTISLPRVGADEVNVVKESLAAVAVVPRQLPLEGRLALVVDDELELREIVEFILTSEGATVQTAKNGEEALAQWQKTDYDFIITDLNMPQMNGPKMIEKMMDSKAVNTRVFVLTGGVSNDWHLVNGRDISAVINGTITKPFSKTSLIDTILKHVT